MLIQTTRLIVCISILFLWGCQSKPPATPLINCTYPFDIEELLLEYEYTKVRPTVDFDKKLPPKHLQKDLSILQHVLEEANTSLYRYTSKPTLDSVFNSKHCAAQDSMTYLSFVRDIASIFNTVACGHSGWAHNVTYKEYRNANMRFFPLKIHAINDQYFVKRNGSFTDSIKTFDEILSINGKSPVELNTSLKSFMVKDGESGLNGRSEIGRYFHMAYSNFIANPDTFSLQLKSYNTGKKYKLRLPALHLSTIDSILQKRYTSPPSNNSAMHFASYPERKTAIFSIPTFSNEKLAQQHQSFEHYTDSIFEELSLQQVQNLVIDLRGNTGGWTANGKYLFSYFIEKPIPYIPSVTLNKVDSFSFTPLIERDMGLHDTMEFKKIPSGLMEWKNYPSLVATPATNNRFKGKTFILTDDLTRSCSAIYSALMHSHTSAIFIGEETGGAQCGQNGMLMYLKLPYSGIRFRISTGLYQGNVTNTEDKRGILPDYEVVSSIQDIATQHDPQLENVWELIKE